MPVLMVQLGQLGRLGRLGIRGLMGQLESVQLGRLVPQVLALLACRDQGRLERLGLQGQLD